MDADQDDGATFERRLDAVVRELGERGKPGTARLVSEGVPPPLAASRDVTATPPRTSIASNQLAYSPSVQSSPAMQIVPQQPAAGGGTSMAGGMTGGSCLDVPTPGNVYCHPSIICPGFRVYV